MTSSPFTRAEAPDGDLSALHQAANGLDQNGHAPSATIAAPARDRPSTQLNARLADSGVRIAAALARWLLPVVVFGAIAGRHWRRWDDFVTGLDPGNWLAVGRGLFGDGGKSTEATYPPFVPALLHIGQVITDPMTAAKVVGLGSLVAIMAVTYLVARQALNQWFALAVAATTGLAGAVAELMVLGSYPQHFAFAFLVLAALALARYLAAGQRRHLIWLAAASSGAAVSHHMYFAVTCLVLGVVWAIWLSTGPSKVEVILRTRGAILAGGVGLLCFLPTLLALRRAGYDAPINTGGLNPHDALLESIRESARLWLLVFVAGATFVALTYRRRGEPAWQVAATLMATVLVLFPITGEQRLLPLFVVGATLGLGFALQDLWSLTRHTVWGGLPLAAATIPILLLLSPRADATLDELYESARVADRSLMNATAFVDQHHRDGLVVVRQDRQGLPVGWWFEGLTEARIAVGSYEGALAFPEERENARTVDLFFDQELTTADVAALAQEHGVDLLVFRKWEWLGWLAWLDEPEPAIAVVYDDGEFMIFDVRPQ